jgi:hypothetical protein
MKPFGDLFMKTLRGGEKNHQFNGKFDRILKE